MKIIINNLKVDESSHVHLSVWQALRGGKRTLKSVLDANGSILERYDCILLDAYTWKEGSACGQELHRVYKE
ncbi:MULTISPECIES: hypothetical protein [Paenibacillus]|uniref:hypothetical protein n=1 Tax=Paenibacillus TaxID=44249 RepID=UPI0005694BDA|nr:MULTISPECIES: hypothetical protein [Paenibacillus]MBV6715897.1 hypothetical protein [Paenibacillus chitinolyticus]